MAKALRLTKGMVITGTTFIVLVGLLFVFSNLDKLLDVEDQYDIQPDIVVQNSEADEFLGGVRTAASCDETEVWNAVSAAVSGDTILVPPGSCTWTTNRTVPDTKRLLLKGAGPSLTHITTDAAMTITLGNSNTSVTGFHFVVDFTSASTPLFEIDGGANNSTWRFWNNHFDNSACTGAGGDCATGSGKNRLCIRMDTQTADGRIMPAGLIDHNIFSNCRPYTVGDTSSITVVGGPHDGQTVEGGSEEWFRPTNWGAGTNLYIENNLFDFTINQGNCIDAQYGGRYVARFNEIRGCPPETHGLTTGRATRSLELYFNWWSSGSNNPNFATFLRGGSTIVFGNRFVTAYTGSNVSIQMDDTRAGRTTTNGGQVGDFYNDGCEGQTAWDENSIAWPLEAGGYRCLDQIGTGIDGTFFVPGSGASFTQASEPAPIFWNRISNVTTTFSPDIGQNATVTVTNTATSPTSTTSDYIQDARDFQQECFPGYPTCTSFNGTRGTGTGPTIAQAPATCTASPAVYYWAYDEGQWNGGVNSYYTGQGRLYKCTATNTWTLYFTPFDFPHPLSQVANIEINGSTIEINGSTIHLKSSYLPPYIRPEPLSLIM